MDILILGGTVFLGRAIAEEALARGHTLTLFNRGKSGADLFPQAEKLIGDRETGDYAALQGRRFDAVIDPSAYVPRHVAEALDALASVGHYTMVSSISVYDDYTQHGIDEAHPVSELVGDMPGGRAGVTGENYGALKALCEKAAIERMGERALNVRAGLIIGPHDPTDRFTYWPLRVLRGGQLLAPQSPDFLVQAIDARDIAAWVLNMVERGTGGTYNVTGPREALTLGQVIEICRDVSSSDAVPVWVDADFLIHEGVQPWSELPLWLPPSPEYAGMHAIDISAALATGLSHRPLAQTIADTLAWAHTRDADYKMRAGLDAEKERALLEKWRAQQG